MAIVQKRLCSEKEANAEHAYYYHYSCPKCGRSLGTSISSEEVENCEECGVFLQYN